MLDYGRRFLIVLIIGVCISLLFIGGITRHEVEERSSSDEKSYLVA